MRNKLAAIAVSLGFLSTYCAAAPVAVTGPIQWSSGSGGNDHYYQLFFDNSSNGGIQWTAANTFATNMGWHLVTLTSGAEEAFVNSTFNPSMPVGSGNGIFGTEPHYWIGLYSPLANGTFQWVTGETLAYTNWNGGEPNNLSFEPYVADRYAGNWNNLPDTGTTPFLPASYFVVENSVPEPASVVLVGAGVAVLAWRRRRL